MSAWFAFVRSTVARWSVSCSSKISGGPDLNRLARFRGHVGKRLAQLIDRPSDLSGQAPGEQEARGRKASAQHDRPAHRAPSRLLQLRFLDRDAHRPVAYGWMGIGAYERVALKGGILEQPRLIFDGAPPLRGELADLGRFGTRAMNRPSPSMMPASQFLGMSLGTEEAQEFPLLS